MFAESSYGAIRFPQEEGKVVTVKISKSVASLGSECGFWNVGVDGDAAVREQHPYIEPDDYLHRSYYIPTEIQGCAWGGIAYVGCTDTHCKSWIRNKNGPVLAHEIGHNLGLNHAGYDSDNDGVKNPGLTGEYGDSSGVMGNSGVWRGVNAPHRLALGWVAASDVFEAATSCTSKATVNLTALYAQAGIAQHAMIKIPRRAGGFYFVSFRNDAGYDSTLATKWINKVSIHYELSSAHGARFSAEIYAREFHRISRMFVEANMRVANMAFLSGVHSSYWFAL
jgi:hypothetical protein